MYNVGADWNPRQRRLREALSGTGGFGEAMRVCLELHGIVHTSAVSSSSAPTYMDEIWEELPREVFNQAIETKNGFGRRAAIAWDIWHITRIEDLTANILIADGTQVLDTKWLERLGVAVTETGNAMSDAEILDFSRSLDPEVLREYRDAVGSRTRAVINGLTAEDIKRKFRQDSLDRILQEGGVVTDEKSIWLLDFWGRKNVGGILLMPITRHQIVHLNECARIKDTLMKKGKRAK